MLSSGAKKFGRNTGVALIRADGSKEIGMGHLSRACLLLNMLKNRYDVQTKLIVKEDSAAENFLGQREIETILLPKPVSIAEEVSLMRQIVEEERPVLFILDVLEHDINSSYMKPIRGFGCPIVAITDDSNPRIIDADIVLNGHPNRLVKNYFGENGNYLLGPKYFLVDPVYQKLKARRPKGKVNKILLTFGGSDQNNLLFRALDSLEKIGGNHSVLVISSKASGYVGELQGRLKNLSIPSELFLDVKSLAPFWQQCDIAITAGGNTLFERIAARVPGGTICQLKRQMEIADCFESLGVNVNFGFGPEVSSDILCNQIKDFIDNKELRYSQYKKSSEIIDGKGVIRLGNEIESLIGGGK